MFRQRLFSIAKVSALAFFVYAGAARAQDSAPSTTTPSIRAVTVTETLLEKAEQVFSGTPTTDTPTGVDFTGLEVATLPVTKAHPFPEGKRFELTTSYGEVRITGSDDRIIQINATLRAGGADAEKAKALLDRMSVKTEIVDGNVIASSVFPSSSDDRSGYDATYRISVPRDATVVVNNTFGDTVVSGLTGAVTIDAKYGLVDLRGVTGGVTVRAQGDFPLYAEGLGSGGVFTLRGTRALFVKPAGALGVVNHLGRTEVRFPAEGSDIALEGENADVHLVTANDGTTEISASSMFGAIESALAVTQSQQGAMTVARAEASVPGKRVSIQTTFSNIYLEEGAPEEISEGNGAAKLEAVKVQELLEQAIAPDGRLTIAAEIPGDITVTGGDGDTVIVTANKTVRVATASKAPFALQALKLGSNAVDGGIEITTRSLEDMAALGASNFRMDLVVQCPRTVSVSVKGLDGVTSISRMAGACEVEQTAGLVRVDHAAAPVRVVNHRGGVEASECSSGVSISLTGGIAAARNVSGPLSVEAKLGNAVIDTPRGPVTVNVEGNVVILSVDGVLGAYDVNTTNGDINIVIPRESDASVWANTTGGVVLSSIELAGTIQGNERRYHGKLNGGVQKVNLTAVDGNIIIE